MPSKLNCECNTKVISWFFIGHEIHNCISEFHGTRDFVGTVPMKPMKMGKTMGSFISRGMTISYTQLIVKLLNRKYRLQGVGVCKNTSDTGRLIDFYSIQSPGALSWLLLLLIVLCTSLKMRVCVHIKYIYKISTV